MKLKFMGWLGLSLLALGGEEIPDVEMAIPGPVKALGPPAMMNFQRGIRMAVTASTDKAQEHVNQGLNHLHGGWEFEASRHFAAAMREDPDCLLAHWGMVMALLSPSPESGPARNAATDRLLELIEQGRGGDLERGYAFGLVKYIEEGPSGAALAFHKVSTRFPNDFQSGIFNALFSRGGFDILGEPTPDQEEAEKILRKLIERHPESPLPLHALLTIRAEGRDLTEFLPLARDLCQMVPDYPPYFHLLGHYEWRCGEHGRAASAFGRATMLFERWMKEHGVSHADCPEWVKSECYRIVALCSKGDFETAYAAARQIAAITAPENRPSSAGARILLWEASTLPARVLMHRGLPGNAAEALVSLPDPEATRKTRDTSLAYWWVDGLRFALDAQRLIDAGEFDKAAEVSNALTHHGEAMTQTQAIASAAGERSAWNRAFRALEVLASETRGRLAMAGPARHRGSAYNWFRSAADRQLPSTMLYPPALLTPMAHRLGEYYLLIHKPAEAVAAYEEALETFPNDMRALEGLRTAAEAAGLADKAAETAERIEKLRPP
jgi:tetratricopeptide (TPR) repeat protein